jgi:hypothetical protein
MKSKIFTIDGRDLLNGLFVAILTAILTGIIDILGNGAVFDWIHIKPVLIAGISAACAYLLKSLSTNSRNQLFTKEPVS